MAVAVALTHAMQMLDLGKLNELATNLAELSPVEMALAENLYEQVKRERFQR